MTSVVYTIAGALSWPLMRGVYRLQVTGIENIPESGLVLAANHTSNFTVLSSRLDRTSRC